MTVFPCIHAYLDPNCLANVAKYSQNQVKTGLIGPKTPYGIFLPPKTVFCTKNLDFIHQPPPSTPFKLSESSGISSENTFRAQKDRRTGFRSIFDEISGFRLNP